MKGDASHTDGNGPRDNNLCSEVNLRDRCVDIAPADRMGWRDRNRSPI